LAKKKKTAKKKLRKTRPASRKKKALPESAVRAAERLLGSVEAKAIAARAPHEKAFMTAVLTAAAKRVEHLPGQVEPYFIERVADEIPYGLFVVDGDGRLGYVNRAAEVMCGRKGVEVVGREIDEGIGGGALSSQFRVVVDRARSGKAPLEYEISYSLQSGAHFDIGLTASLMGEVTSHREEGQVVVVARDLHAPAERLKLRAPANITAEQQADLRRRLRQAERQMARSEKLVAVGQMAAGFVHEINNPLGALSGLIQVMEMDLDEKDPSREMLEEVAQELDRIHRIADSMLELARSSSGEGSEAFQAVDLDDLVKSVLRLMGPQLRVARVKSEVVVDGKRPWVYGDPDRLKQVLMNLILNAAQSMSPSDQMPPKGGRVRVAIGGDEVRAEDMPPRPTRAADLAGRDTRALHAEAENRAAGDQAPPWQEGLPLVRIEVSDTGPGIPEDKLARLFEPFFTTKPPGEGTGLGLSTVEAIIRAHGGTITAGNRPEGGAVFSIRLPASAARAAE